MYPIQQQDPLLRLDDVPIYAHYPEEFPLPPIGSHCLNQYIQMFIRKERLVNQEE